ncbi:MAG: hypothetical protein DMD60_05350 [Gemmatimonadetes bacterium]|nr:MAG: hypothetical protein DMD60_05350 [Gemmatimonadota bacterium]
MAMFTEKGQGGGLESESGLSIIGTGMRVVGDISADGVVKIEGTVVGTVRAGRQVLVGKGGEVEGDVISRGGRRDQRGRAHGRSRARSGDGGEGRGAAVLLDALDIHTLALPRVDCLSLYAVVL